MTNSRFRLLSLIFIGLLASSATAEIKALEISSGNRLMIFFKNFGTHNRPMIVLDKFRFARTGHVSISVKALSVASSLAETDFSGLGFFLLPSIWRHDVFDEIDQNPNFCVLDSRYIKRLFNFSDLSRPPQSSFNRSYPVTVPIEYRLIFTSCAPQTSVSMQVRTEVYNLNRDGSKDYLSVGLTKLPSLYFYFSLAYLLIFALWIYDCATNKPYVHRIHLLMGGLLLVKALSLLCAAEEKQYVKIHGTPHGWDVLSQISQFIHISSLLTAIVVIGTRFSLLKPFLQGKKVLMVVIPLQALANVYSVFIGKIGPFTMNCSTLNLFFLLLLDVTCCCPIYFPILRSIPRLLIKKWRTDGKAAGDMAKLTLFSWFCFVVIWYLIYKSFGAFFLKFAASVEIKYQLVSDATAEVVNIFIYMVMFYIFRPVEKNENFVQD